MQSAAGPDSPAAVSAVLWHSKSKRVVLVAAGLIGMFAEKRSAELVAMQSFAEYRASPQAKSQGMSAA